MTEIELNQWYANYRQYKNAYHFSENDWSNFVRLNHLVMEASHEVHNKNMLKK